MDPEKGFNGDENFNNKTYAISGKIMMAAIMILFTVVLFILGLHLYARFFWHRSLGNSVRRRGSRRRRLSFSGDQDPVRLQRVGLEKSVIETLPVFVYRAEDNREEGLECAVCLCEFEENEKARRLPKCNHSFHIECIDMWFDSHSTCPLCRSSVRPDPSADAAGPIEVVVVGETSGTAGAEESPAEGSQHELCSSCRHADGLPSPTYPTNVLFWGNQNRVSLRSNSNAVEGTSSGKSKDKIAVDIPPRRYENFSSPRVYDDQQMFSSGGPLSLKSPGSTRLRSLKRLLSRAVPQSPDGGGHMEQGGSGQV